VAESQPTDQGLVRLIDERLALLVNARGGPLDDLILAKVRVLVETVTDPAKLAASVAALWPQLSPMAGRELGALLSDKLRTALHPALGGAAGTTGQLKF
jgi:hypothetical protein